MIPRNTSGRTCWTVSQSMVVVLATAVWGAPPAVGQPPAGAVLYRHGQLPIPAQLTGVQQGEFHFQAGSERLRMASGQFVYWGTLPEDLDGPRVLLADGSSLAGTVLGVTEEQVEMWSDVFGTVVLPRDHVTAVVLQRSAGTMLERDRRIDQLLQGTTADRLALISGDVLAARTVRLEGGWLTVDAGGQTNRLAASQVWCAVLSQPVQDAKRGEGVWIGLRDGSLLRQVEITLEDDRLELKSGAGWTLTSQPYIHSIQEQWVTYVRSPGDAWQSLVGRSDLSHRQVSLLDLSWPLERNRNVLGGRLRVQGRIYPVGLGVHSACRITVDVPEGAKEFAAEVALDDVAAPQGSVAFRVFTYSASGGWSEAYTSGMVRAGADVQAVRVGLQGATRLALAVDPADDWDVRDYANWLEPRFHF